MSEFINQPDLACDKSRNGSGWCQMSHVYAALNGEQFAEANVEADIREHLDFAMQSAWPGNWIGDPLKQYFQ